MAVEMIEQYISTRMPDFVYGRLDFTSRTGTITSGRLIKYITNNYLNRKIRSFMFVRAGVYKSKPNAGTYSNERVYGR